MKFVRALINGEPARSMDDVVPGAELSFDGEVRVGDVVLFGEERYRATRGEGGVAFDKIECPSCSAVRVVPIAYGEPTAETWERAKRGEVAIGGCMVGRDSAAWACRGCGHEFGQLGDEHPEMFKWKERSDG